MNRKKMRETAVKILYEMDIHKIFDLESANNYFESHNIDVDKDNYLPLLIEHFINNKDQIDKKIEENVQSWALNRIAKLDLSILRVGFTEILFMDVPHIVSVNEAVELGKIYGDDSSYKFINGVFGNLLKSLQEK